jgi:hypothetical protein
MNDTEAKDYARRLVEKGIDPETAVEIARKAQQAQEPQQAAQGMSNAPTPAVPAKVDNAKKAPAQKRRSSATKKATTTSGSEKADKPRKQPTRADIALIDASAQIMETPPTGNDLAFNHGILCQVGLPRSKVEGSSFLRQSGDAWISIQAGLLDEGNGPVQQTVPYGPLPRLALAWVSTYAVRHKTAEVPIGESAAEFLRMMGMESEGRRYSTLRTQMHALASCHLQMGFRGRTWNAQPIDHFDAWVSDKESKQRPLWPGTLRLHDSFYNILMERPVPLDNRALLALKGSALALDIYCWLAHRLHRIEGRPLVLHWHSLREQFAQEYRGKNPDKDFKDTFIPQLHKVLMVYPDAKVKQVTGGLLLMPSPPPVPYKG